MLQQKIEFNKDRDFGSVIGDALKFIKQNFKSFFGSIVLIIGPFILLMGFVYSYIQANMLSTTFSSRSFGQSMFNSNYFLSLGIIYLLVFVNSILLNSVIYNYMGLYSEKPFGEKITISEVASRVWSNIGRVMLSMGMFLFGVIVIGIVVFLIALGFSSMGVLISVLLGLAVFFGILIVGPVIFYYISAAFYVVVRDGIFIFPAIEKVRQYASGSFWWTWLIIVVALIGVGILQFIFNLPATIITITEAFTKLKHINDVNNIGGSGNNVWLIVFYTIGMFLTTCSSSILHLICAFNFLGHEEKKEGFGLISRMDQIK